MQQVANLMVMKYLLPYPQRQSTVPVVIRRGC